MDERGDPQTNAPDEGELLAAYLDAETDDITSARLERQLRQDPQAAARLDALARTRARLQRLDDVVPPDGFRDRLDARLRAERADHPVVRRAPSRRAGNRFAPLAAAAALVLLTVLGGAALLNLGQAGSGEEAAGSAAEVQADAPAEGARAPLSSPDVDAEAEAAGADDGTRTTGGDLAAALPRVSADADIAARLDRQAQSTDDPAAREAELRQRAGLPAVPVCLSDIDATAVDLVELDGQLVLAARVTDRDGPQVAIFDPQACARLRTFTP